MNNRTEETLAYPTPAQLDHIIASAMADHFETILPGVGADRTTTETIMLSLFKVAMETMRATMDRLGPPPMPPMRPRQTN